MDIEKLKKPNKNSFDAEKFFDKNGNIIPELFDELIKQKPILPAPKAEGRQNFFAIKENRDRYEVFPDRLPTRGLLPQPIDAHEMIGNFETNHTIYLTIANAYNKAMEKIEQLEARIVELENR